MMNEVVNAKQALLQLHQLLPVLLEHFMPQHPQFCHYQRLHNRQLQQHTTTASQAQSYTSQFILIYAAVL